MQKIFNEIISLNEELSCSNKVLLVCDRSFHFLNIKDDIEHISVPYVVFDQFTPNPLYEDVCKGVELFQNTQCDTIMAVGGGSSMDVAKCIKLYCKMEKGKLYLEQEYKDTGVKLIAIPTTAGTGSESTQYAVIYYNDKKQSVTHESIIPNVVILESKVLDTLPLYQKKCTMMDALCQAIESWWSVNSTTESKEYSREAVKTIIQWWHEYIFENTKASAKAIMYAANLAGRAICITQTTAPHAFSYKITSLYKLPHGHAVAIGMPIIWEYMINNLDKCIDDRGQNYLTKVFSEIAYTMGYNTPMESIGAFKQMLKDMDLKNPTSKNRERDIKILSTSVNPIRLKNNPVKLSLDSIRCLYEDIITEIPMNTIADCKIVELPRFLDTRGNLSFAEQDNQIPFKIKRVYWIYDVPGGENRGAHAHKELSQLIIAVSGSFTVTLDDGMNKRDFFLNRPYIGLYVKPGLWRNLEDFSSGSVCLVLASDIYKTEDYIRDYQDYLEYRKG